LKIENEKRELIEKLNIFTKKVDNAILENKDQNAWL
jgi:hypothetical protein